MNPKPKRFAFLLLAALASLLWASASWAKPSLSAAPIFGQAGGITRAWSTVVAVVTNDKTGPAKGTVTADCSGHSLWGGRNKLGTVRASYQLAPGAQSVLRLPISTAGGRMDCKIYLQDEHGKELSKLPLPVDSQPSILVVDLAKGRTLAAAIEGAFIPDTSYPHPTRSVPRSRLVGAAEVQTNGTTGELILPQRLWEYARATLVITSSADLSNLGTRERAALANWVLAGGHLAVSVTRPEDLRLGPLPKLVGGEISASKGAGGPVAGPVKAKQELPKSNLRGGSPVVAAKYVRPSDELEAQFVSYAGGNLIKSRFGATAPYGEGQVHLLPIDLHGKGNLKSPWVVGKIVDMTRRAEQSQKDSTVLVTRGSWSPGSKDIASLLNPNIRARWAIAIATLLLLLYSVVAGPLNFNRAAKDNRPLVALLRLPILSGATFAFIVLIGAVSRGCGGQAGRVSLVSTSGGMGRGHVLRFRSLYTSGSKPVEIAASDANATIALLDRRDSTSSALEVTAKGLRLMDVRGLPWESLVFEEHTVKTLRGGVAIVREGKGDARVINRTGQTLRGVVVQVPFGNRYFFETIKPGKSVIASKGKVVWTRPASRTLRPTNPRSDPSVIYSQSQLEDASDGLGDAWAAMENVLGSGVHLFPGGIPVVLAQMDGGDGVKRDSGLKVKRDRLLLRVSGFGGSP